MTHAEAIQRVLDAIEGIEVEGGPNATTAAMLRAGVVLCGVALMRIPNPHERDARMDGIELAVRDYIERVLARRSPYPRTAANGQVLN